MKKTITFFLALIFSGQFSYCLAAMAPPKKPKNIILMVGDGMGLVHLYAAYVANGGKLDIYAYAQSIGLSITKSADNLITDSAAGATAFATGQKTNNGMVSVAPDSTKLPTIAEQACAAGKSTGIVVSCELPHATPAAFYAHQPSRRMYPQIVKDMSQSCANVMIGGGFPYFDTTLLGKNGFQVSVGMAEMRGNNSNKQVCFYNADSVPRRFTQGRGDALREGSLHAIDILSKNKNGFFLMIEGSQIDWGGHDNDSAYVIEEAVDFDRTAGAVLQWALNDKNTLVIITADHECGGLTLTDFDSLSNRPYMNFSTGDHTAEPVPVYAFGPGAAVFSGVYENTEIYVKMKTLFKLK